MKKFVVPVLGLLSHGAESIEVGFKQSQALTVSDLQNEFTKFDSDQDLFLDAREIISMVRNLHVAGLNSDEQGILSAAETVKSRLDIDMDGVVSLPEFTSQIPVHHLVQERVEAAPETLSTNAPTRQASASTAEADAEAQKSHLRSSEEVADDAKGFVEKALAACQLGIGNAQAMQELSIPPENATDESGNQDLMEQIGWAYNNSSEANLNALAAANLFKDYDSLLLIQNQFVELTKAAAKLAEQSITIQSEIQQVVSQEKDGTKKLELAKEYVVALEKAKALLDVALETHLPLIRKSTPGSTNSPTEAEIKDATKKYTEVLAENSPDSHIVDYFTDALWDLEHLTTTVTGVDANHAKNVVYSGLVTGLLFLGFCLTMCVAGHNKWAVGFAFTLFLAGIITTIVFQVIATTESSSGSFLSRIVHHFF